MLNIMKSGGDQIGDSIEDTIHRYEAAFSNAKNVSFSHFKKGDVSPPPKPLPKPGSRDSETRIRKRNDPAPCMKKAPSCSFCGKHPSISNCTQWQKFGHRINLDEEKKMLIDHCTAISNLAGSIFFHGHTQLV